MIMKKLGFLSVAIASMLLAGCRTPCEDNDDVTAKTSNTYAVVVGLEYSRFAGSCPGAGFDAERMRDLLGKYSANVVYLRDSAATKANVVSSLKKAVEKSGESGLVIFYYSGHGGSEPFPDTGIEEDDGSDEYYCLYDTYMRDNDMWKIISQSKGRVFLINDCCHSQSIFREPMVKINPPLSWDHTLNEKSSFSMLCWSGCPDDTYSYGASTGGQFTNALLRHFSENKTYEYLWEEIKNDNVLRRYEDPQSTVLGDGFEAKRVFR